MAVSEPPFNRVLLLLNFEDTEGAGLIFDSSLYADHKAATPGMAITNSDVKHGGGALRVTHRAPAALVYTGARFARPAGQPLTIEGWSRRIASVNAQACPPFLMLRDNFGTDIMALGQQGEANQLTCRFNAATPFTDHAYVPSGDGYFHWVIRFAADNTAELWTSGASGSVLRRTDVINSTWSSTGELRLFGWLTETTDPINFLFDSVRVSAWDVYPDGVEPPTGPFDDGTSIVACKVFPAGAPQ